jgi:hypothetical protein
MFSFFGNKILKKYQKNKQNLTRKNYNFFYILRKLICYLIFKFKKTKIIIEIIYKMEITILQRKFN